MRIRVEFGPSRSPSYAWAVRLAKKLPSYKETVEEGIKVHSVEFTDIETFPPLQRCIGGWTAVAYYLNGQPTTADNLWAHYLKKYPTHGTLHPVETEDGTAYVNARDVVDAEVVREKLAPPRKRRKR